MFTADVVSSEWDVLRLRRLKWSLIRAPTLGLLKDFLGENLDYDLYSQDFADNLAEIVQENLPEYPAEDAQTLAREVARKKPGAADNINDVLAGTSVEIEDILDAARTSKAKELVQQYVQREPTAVTLVHELLTKNGLSMDGLTAAAFAEKLDAIERIDRLISIAESRRNASLHEIERRRAVLGQTLRRSVEEIEDAEFKVIETTPAQGKDVA